MDRWKKSYLIGLIAVLSGWIGGEAQTFTEIISIHNQAKDNYDVPKDQKPHFVYVLENLLNDEIRVFSKEDGGIQSNDIGNRPSIEILGIDQEVMIGTINNILVSPFQDDSIDGADSLLFCYSSSSEILVTFHFFIPFQECCSLPPISRYQGKDMFEIYCFDNSLELFGHGQYTNNDLMREGLPPSCPHRILNHFRLSLFLKEGKEWQTGKRDKIVYSSSDEIEAENFKTIFEKITNTFFSEFDWGGFSPVSRDMGINFMELYR